MRPNFFYHIHPPTVPARQARWSYTLGAGGIAVFLVLVLIATGLLEMFYYTPSPSDAALSIQTISYAVPFGGLIRNLHYWAAQFLVLTAFVHLFRVVLTGAYAPPRRFNYLLGMALFILVILLDFTGYILRWDQGIQWALIVGTNLVKTIPGIGGTFYRILMGGDYPGSATLTRFYAWHVYGLMLPSFVLIVWHIFRVRRDGGIAIPPPNFRTEVKRIAREDLVRQEVIVMLICVAVLFLVSIFIPAPIAPMITKIQAAPSDASAPWFFLWIQQMLKWGDPFLWGVLIPLLILGVIAMIPYVLPKPNPRQLGRWFPSSNRLAQIVLAVIAVAILLLTLWKIRPGA